MYYRDDIKHIKRMACMLWRRTTKHAQHCVSKNSIMRARLACVLPTYNIRGARTAEASSYLCFCFQHLELQIFISSGKRK